MATLDAINAPPLLDSRDYGNGAHTMTTLDPINAPPLLDRDGAATDGKNELKCIRECGVAKERSFGLTSSACGTVSYRSIQEMSFYCDLLIQ